MTRRWKVRPPGSNWGDFGDDDQRGRLNLLTPEKVLQGVAEVKAGRSFCLSLPLDYPGGSKLNPRRHPPALQPTYSEGQPFMNFPYNRIDSRYTDVVNDDAVLLYLQYSTQWDALAHVGGRFDADGDGIEELVYYNGFRAGEDIFGPIDYTTGEPSPTPDAMGAQALGIENIATSCVQGRAVLINLQRRFGEERVYVDYDLLMQVCAEDGVAVEAGDMVCLYTGYADLLLDMAKDPDVARLQNACAVLDGRDPRLLDWVTDSGLVALIADNYGVEAIPSRPGCDHFAHLPLHEHCLFKLGIPLGEMWHLAELAQWLGEHNRSRFLLTAPPLRLPGAVGSPATPVATV